MGQVLSLILGRQKMSIELHPSLPAALSPSDVKKMMEELADLKKEREELAQRLHDTEQLVNTVKNEKASVASELEQLQAQVRHSYPPWLNKNFQ